MHATSNIEMPVEPLSRRTSKFSCESSQIEIKPTATVASICGRFFSSGKNRPKIWDANTQKIIKIGRHRTALQKKSGARSAILLKLLIAD
jgi:hypothetical protein